MSLLSVKDVGKAFRSYGSEWQRFARWFGLSATPSEENWVLRHVSFDVQKGESIGIIGMNGAGKSTLLKMITGTLQPTEGKIQVHGRIAAILELGMGFNPDLTGRQNAYHGLGLMGYTHSDIEQVMPALEAFAEVGEYFDAPVRTYSSGMQMRVAFAVATAYRPEILILDEVLAVGDIFFQQKCFARIREYQKQESILIFVSHDLASVCSLCDRALLIDAGELVLDDKPKTVIDLYNANMITHSNPDAAEATVQSPPDNRSENSVNDVHGKDRSHGCSPVVGSYTNQGVVIEDVHLLVDGCEVVNFTSGSDVRIRIRIVFLRAYRDPHVGFQVRNFRGEIIFMTTTFGMKKTIGPVEYGSILDVMFSFKADFSEGDYSLTVGAANEVTEEGFFKESLSRKQEATVFSVLKNHESIVWAGVYNISPSCKFSLRHQMTDAS